MHIKKLKDKKKRFQDIKSKYNDYLKSKKNKSKK